MKGKFHINSKGEPGVCSASNGGCPFGEHYSTVEEAQKAYDKTWGEGHLKSLNKTKRNNKNSPSEKLNKLEETYSDLQFEEDLYGQIVAYSPVKDNYKDLPEGMSAIKLDDDTDIVYTNLTKDEKTGEIREMTSDDFDDKDKDSYDDEFELNPSSSYENNTNNLPEMGEYTKIINERHKDYKELQKESRNYPNPTEKLTELWSEYAKKNNGKLREAYQKNWENARKK